jgi:hypothetical protein
MGEKSWYIPRWLDRLLPNLTIEPPHDDSQTRAPVGGKGPADATQQGPHAGVRSSRRSR